MSRPIVKPDDPASTGSASGAASLPPVAHPVAQEELLVHLLQPRTEGQASWCPACGQRLPGGITRFGTGRCNRSVLHTTALPISRQRHEADRI